MNGRKNMSKKKPDKYTALFQRVRVYDKIPDGWHINTAATTAPPGYEWINNYKNSFDPNYEHGLLHIRKHK